MADTKISALTDATAITDTDYLVIVDDVGGTPTTKRLDAADAKTYFQTGAHLSGGTDVPVADGGTGASDASGARTNLGLGLKYHKDWSGYANIAAVEADGVAFAGGGTAALTDISTATGNAYDEYFGETNVLTKAITYDTPTSSGGSTNSGSYTVPEVSIEIPAADLGNPAVGSLIQVKLGVYYDILVDRSGSDGTTTLAGLPYIQADDWAGDVVPSFLGDANLWSADNQGLQYFFDWNGSLWEGYQHLQPLDLIWTSLHDDAAVLLLTFKSKAWAEFQLRYYIFSLDIEVVPHG